MLQVEHACVPGLLPLDGSPDDLQQLLLVNVGITDTVAERDFGVAKEAYLQVTVSRQSNSITGAAKVLCHGCDEAHAASVAWHLISLQQLRTRPINPKLKSVPRIECFYVAAQSSDVHFLSLLLLMCHLEHLPIWIARGTFAG